MNATAYRVLALVVLALVILYALHRYHERQKLAMRQEYATFEDYEKVTIGIRDEIWKCLRCRVPLLSWPDVEAHDDPELSPCAAMAVRQEAAAEAAKEPVPWTAVVDGARGEIDD
jgi:hypothetical protein